MMTRIVRILLLSLLAASGTVLSADEPLFHLQVGGLQRLYLLHDFSGSKPAPLVIVLHGGGGNGENAMLQTGFDEVARREGLVVAYPYGTSRRSDTRLLTWNAGHCCSHALRSQADDVGFIAALIDSLVASGNADPERVYVTGLSNGGMMTHRLALELPDKITAAAPVIASLFGDESETPVQMPMLIINGADDEIVKPAGGRLRVGAILGRRAADMPVLPITSQGTFWAARNGCIREQHSNTAHYELHAFTACAGDAEVLQYVVKANGHAWPGGTAPRAQADVPSPDFSASEEIWAFFSRWPAVKGE